MIYTSEELNLDASDSVDTDAGADQVATPDRADLEREAMSDMIGRATSSDKPAVDDKGRAAEEVEDPSAQAEDADDPDMGLSDGDQKQSQESAPEDEDENQAEGEQDKEDAEDDGSLAEEILSKAKDDKRVSDSLRAFHESREENAKLRKQLDARDAEMKRIAERLERIEQGRQEDDSPVDYEKLGLSASAREVLETIKDDPEGKEILKALKKNLQQERPVEEEQADATQDTTEQADATKQAQGEYMRVVQTAYPEFEEVIASKDYEKFRDTHQKTIKTLIDGLDEFDPQGAIRVMRAFERWHIRSQAAPKAKTSSVRADQLPSGRKASAPPKSGQVREDRRALEREALAEMRR